jgi:hypothetical protein
MPTPSFDFQREKQYHIQFTKASNTGMLRGEGSETTAIGEPGD